MVYGNEGATDTSRPRPLSPREWDEAVRALGVQRAVSETSEAQEEILMEHVKNFAINLKGKTLGREQVKFLINTCLIPKLEFPVPGLAANRRRRTRQRFAGKNPRS